MSTKHKETDTKIDWIKVIRSNQLYFRKHEMPFHVYKSQENSCIMCHIFHNNKQLIICSGNYPASGISKIVHDKNNITSHYSLLINGTGRTRN